MTALLFMKPPQSLQTTDTQSEARGPADYRHSQRARGLQTIDVHSQRPAGLQATDTQSEARKPAGHTDTQSEACGACRP